MLIPTAALASAHNAFFSRFCSWLAGFELGAVPVAAQLVSIERCTGLALYGRAQPGLNLSVAGSAVPASGRQTFVRKKTLHAATNQYPLCFIILNLPLSGVAPFTKVASTK